MATNQAIVTDHTSGISGVPCPSATSLLGFPIGLSNLGNTCFANSVLQALFCTRSFHSGIISHAKVPGCNLLSPCFLCEVKAVFVGLLVDPGPSFSPSTFVSYNVMNSILPQWQMGAQEDAHEFFLGLLRVVGTQIGTILSSEFMFERQSTLMCDACKTSKRPRRVSHDHVLVDLGKRNIQEAIDCAADIKHDGGAYCNRCNGTKVATETCPFATLPATLIIFVKRFTFDSTTRQTIKCRDNLQVLPILKLKNINNVTKSYHLYSAIVHHGGPNSGHYISYGDVGSNNWYCFNDSSVSKVTLQTVISEALCDTYILLYREIVTGQTVNDIDFSRRRNAVTQRSLSLKKRVPVLKSLDEEIKKCQQLMSVSSIVSTISCNLAGQNFGMDIHGCDLARLKQLQQVTNVQDCWLNDNIVNGYMLLICDYAKKCNKTIIPLSSQLVNRLLQKGVDFVVQSWYRKKVLINGIDMWLIPIEHNHHWTMLVVDFKRKVLSYTDSLGSFSDSKSHLLLITEYIQKRHVYENNDAYSPFQCKQVPSPQQNNGVDCGIFAIKMAFHLALDVKPVFTKNDIPRFRNEICCEIVRKQLIGDTGIVHSSQTVAQPAIASQPKVVKANTCSTTVAIPQQSIGKTTIVNPSQNVAQQAITLTPKAVNSTSSTVSQEGLPLSKNPASASLVFKLPMKSASTPPKTDKPSCDLVDFNCPECRQKYASKKSLQKHMRVKHSGSVSGGTLSCLEGGCSFTTNFLYQLRDHLQNSHSIIMDKASKEFATFGEFEEWKHVFEEKRLSSFVQTTGSKKTIDDKKVLYYYCNRSGYFRSKGKGERHIESQGTSKINAYCTATIKATVEETGVVFVELCETHYGHEIELGHLRLPENVRLAIAGKLRQGVTMEHILDDVRDSVGNDVERIHLLTRKDMHNIESSFNLVHARKHKDDATSVDCWVSEMTQTESTNPVIFYKPQGCPQGNDCDDFSDEDFAVCIQTPFQATMMRKLGEGKIICIDSTHGTTGYNFSLVTIIVVDELGEGFPVGWCLSNREDAIVIRKFLEAIKKRTGQINPAWFMSDDASQFFNAWLGVFGGSPKKILCIWHVDKNWREKLSVIKDKEMQLAVYHNLRVLLEERDIDKFESLYEKTLQQLAACSDTEQFREYFLSTYGKRKNEWAMCYRQGAFTNTNMYVEAFHRVLKYIYLKGKVNKRVDICLHSLIKIARDKFFERLVKLSKGKCSLKIDEIRTRHDKSELLDLKLVTEISETEYKVDSASDNGTYTVTLLNSCVCKLDNCLLRCLKCNICIHMYSCTCPDYSVAANMCKHIHLVGRLKLKQSSDSKQPSIVLHTQMNDMTSALSLGKKATTTLDEVKRIARQSIQHLTALIEECQNEDLISEVISDTNKSIRILKSDLHVVTLPPLSRNDPGNKKISPQRGFFSTVKRKREAPVRIAKPTNTERQEVIDTLCSGLKAYHSKKTAKDLLCFLCSKETASRVIKENRATSVRTNKFRELPDEIIDYDWTLVRNYIDDKSWQSLMASVEEKVNQWMCTRCKLATTALNMVECEQCSCWYHWDCVGISGEPDSWNCYKCIKRGNTQT